MNKNPVSNGDDRMNCSSAHYVLTALDGNRLVHLSRSGTHHSEDGDSCSLVFAAAFPPNADSVAGGDAHRNTQLRQLGAGPANGGMWEVALVNIDDTRWEKFAVDFRGVGRPDILQKELAGELGRDGM